MAEVGIVPVDYMSGLVGLETEQRYINVRDFVLKQGHASCFEIMKEFQFSYAQAVSLMNILERRGIVDISDPIEYAARDFKGPDPS